MPHLAIELRRKERTAKRTLERAALPLLIKDDPAVCSVSGGGAVGGRRPELPHPGAIVRKACRRGTLLQDGFCSQFLYLRGAEKHLPR